MVWDVVYYKAPDGSVPAIDFLDGCPGKVAANLLAVLDAVAEAPPPQYSGGGKWEAMHGSMGGFYEVRATGSQREQFRVFCLLENADSEGLARRGLDAPAIAVITGLRKPSHDVHWGRLSSCPPAWGRLPGEPPEADRHVVTDSARVPPGHRAG